MKVETADRLVELNHQFYQTFGADFSATRARLQPGVRRVLADWEGQEGILDLGCGNGNLARELAIRGHRGPYLGLDFSLVLLGAAGPVPEGFSAQFRQRDITSPDWDADLPVSSFDIICAFAVLHHIPGEAMRLRLLEKARRLLRPEGKIILSSWQFMSSEKFRARLQGWDKAGLSPREVDPDDYLLDWRGGGSGLRYVHHFSEAALGALAERANFRVAGSFYSDGQNRRLGLYQTWERGFLS